MEPLSLVQSVCIVFCFTALCHCSARVSPLGVVCLPDGFSMSFSRVAQCLISNVSQRILGGGSFLLPQLYDDESTWLMVVNTAADSSSLLPPLYSSRAQQPAVCTFILPSSYMHQNVIFSPQNSSYSS